MVKYGEGPYGVGPYGYATAEMLQEALNKLSTSDLPLDRLIVSSLHLEQGHAEFGVEYRRIAPSSVLASTITEIHEERRKAGVVQKGAAGLSSFFLSILDELRAIICGKGKSAKKLGKNSQAILAAVAAVVSRALGIGDPTATGIAVLVLITLGQATKNAFCKMSTAEFLALFNA
jgi:hypothetical protein